MSRTAPLLALAVGALLCVAAAVATSMSAADALWLCALAAGTGAVAVVLGAITRRLLARRALGVQVAAVALTTVVALLVGAYAAAEAMFISEHDLSVLLVVLVAAGTVGVAASLALGRRVEDATTSLTLVARRIGEGDPAAASTEIGGSEELARLGRELAAMQQRLEETQARSRALEASRRELVGWVSHDLRTPLAGIRAMTEALEDGIVDDPETVARYHRRMREEADHLAALVNDLFELSRTHAGALRLDLTSVPLAELVADAIAGSTPVATAKGVHLDARIVGVPPVVRASAPEVLRVLRNLLDNAIRHTPPGGRVVVEAGAEDAAAGRVYVSVRDTGGGVPAEEISRIFDVGYQGDPARAPGAGAGLGLAIAKGFVDAHEGELTVANDAEGACFTVRLPVHGPTAGLS